MRTFELTKDQLIDLNLTGSVIIDVENKDHEKEAITIFRMNDDKSQLVFQYIKHDKFRAWYERSSRSRLPLINCNISISPLTLALILK